ncbi:dihydrolipoyl dehydrogenase [Thiomicrospira aerophila AL3]|uniref:Dihydrolipoyl dehydrogenase n=1 Tax=Thiomicrospira aerophila AL3 TaxID=717772 RepID=W0DQC0_9GAMM|nr:dihydrolipoyl dehydrogenase [Thiomicrospira aerophila]AHF00800.1 dihydrolipoyl dehydrogenase [Thiomicrospira aerophila AL3]
MKTTQQVKRVKFAIIGAGSAGLTAWSEIKKQTDDYVLIDSGPLGTTCARVGCMPSKALIHIAEHYQAWQGAAALGIELPAQPILHDDQVLKRVRRFRDRFTSGLIANTTDKLSEQHFISGRAVVYPNGEIHVDDHVIVAERIIVAVGSKPIVPDGWSANLGDLALTSDTIFELETLPKRLAVIGLGVIGLELGQALAYLGVEVMGFDAQGQVGGLQDPFCNEFMLEHVAKTFPVQINQQVVPLRVQNQVKITYQGGEWLGDKVLLTLGRRPNSDWRSEALQNLTVDPVTLQLGDLPIFVAGDASGFHGILHEANREGKTAAQNAIHYPVLTGSKPLTPTAIVFSDPQLCRVGVSFNELDPREIIIGSFDLNCNNGRAIVMDQDYGRIRLYADRTSGRLLGGELAMPSAEHLGHLLAWSVQTGLTLNEMSAMPFYHPVLEEAVQNVIDTMLDEFNAEQGLTKN